MKSSRIISFIVAFLLLIPSVHLGASQKIDKSSPTKKAEPSKKKSSWGWWAAGTITAVLAAMGGTYAAYEAGYFKGKNNHNDVLFPSAKPIDEFVDSNLNTRLSLAARKGNQAEVSSLIAQDADLNMGNRDGESPLVIAIKAGHPDCAELLITAGAMINLGDAHNNTPLMVALKKNDYVTAKLLLGRGAKTELSNEQQFTALDIALALPDAEKQKPEVAEIIKILRHKTGIHH